MILTGRWFLPYHSPEEVILGRDILIDPTQVEEMHYRREGDDSSAVYI
jgi:hypothetical protein